MHWMENQCSLKIVSSSSTPSKIAKRVSSIGLYLKSLNISYTSGYTGPWTHPWQFSITMESIEEYYVEKNMEYDFSTEEGLKNGEDNAIFIISEYSFEGIWPERYLVIVTSPKPSMSVLKLAYFL